jgi:hypothetical protein
VRQRSHVHDWNNMFTFTDPRFYRHIFIAGEQFQNGKSSKAAIGAIFDFLGLTGTTLAGELQVSTEP